MTLVTGKQSLTKYPLASFRELSALAFPLILSLLSANLVIFVDRYFLSIYSLEAFEACTAAGGLFFLFQVTTLRFVTTIQAFVSHALGSRQKEKAFSYTWQMIWFSLLSFFLIGPIGHLVGYAFFKGTPIETLARTYYNYLIWGNVLFALEGTLSSFLAGTGHTRKILHIHLIANLLNVGFSFFLIFGIEGWIPPLGVNGAAIGTLLAKAASCIWFAYYFLKISKIKWMKIVPTQFLECIRKATPRAIGSFITVLAWNAAAHILIQRGGIDLLVCSFGVSVFMPLINDGVGQAFLSVSSYLLGSNKLQLFPKLFRSTAIFIFLNMCLMSVPFLLYPNILISFFEHIPFSFAERSALLNTCICIALCYFTNSIYVISFMLITAFKDTLFYMTFQTTLGTLSFFLPVFILAKLNSWTPEWFWLANALNCVPFTLIYFMRCNKLAKRKTDYLQGKQAPGAHPIDVTTRSLRS